MAVDFSPLRFRLHFVVARILVRSNLDRMSCGVTSSAASASENFPISLQSHEKY